VGSSEDHAVLTLLESAPDGILLVDESGVIARINQAAEQLFGYARDELVGERIEILVPERLRGRHVHDREGYVTAPRRRPMGFGLELLGVRQDGSEFPVEISLSPMRWQGKSYTVTIARDVTEQRLSEQQRLHLARAQAVEETVSGLEAIVWEATAPDRASLTYLGGREDALLGYPRDAWLREGFWLSVVHPDDRVTALTFAEAAREQETFEIEYRLIAANGDVHQVRDIVSVNRDGEGAVQRLRGVIVDITERLSLETQLARAQRMEAVGQLAGGIAHDFNNLLTIVSGHARRLVREESFVSARGELSQIISATDRAAELTRQLLAFARRGRSEVVVLDPNETIRSLQPMLRRLLSEDIAIDVHLAEATPQVLADRGNLEQVVMNLVLNARDAMPDGGMLTVATEARDLGAIEAARKQVPPGSYFVLRVSDTGTGMEPGLRSRIFEPFFSTKKRGSGMGLATVHGLVEQGGGYVDLESTPGAGTTFWIALPAAVPGETPSEPLPDVERPTVLLVEDETDLRSLAATILEEEGFLVLAAVDGGDAVGVAERHRGRIDLLVTDVVMPRLSGPELAQRLRSLRPNLEVLYMSGYNDSRLVARGVEAGNVKLLAKPFAPDDLVRMVSELTSGAVPADSQSA
jgi:two-component system cell cycle sensor histidine kinase/response regulator CckA